jgi:hypothetical protein
MRIVRVVVVVVVIMVMRARRGVVALPRARNPDLRVSFLPDTTSVGTGTDTRATAAAATAIPSVTMRVSRVLEPVTRIVPLAVLNLKRALFHAQSILIARALADVYWSACAPAVAKGVAVFPVARCAGARAGSGGV